MVKETRPTGTQAVERSIHLLKLLATRGTFGWGLTDLARRSGLEKATVHRILAALEAQRLARHDRREHRYYPGPMLLELGLSVPTHQPLISEGQAAAARLAQRMRCVAFFYLRSGHEFVVACRAGPSARGGMLIEVGHRRPLIVSAGGVAMLVAMPAEERQTVVQRNMLDVAAMGTAKPERFVRMLERSIPLGYAANLEDIVVGIHAFGIVLRDAGGNAMGSVSLAGPPERLLAASADKIVRLLAQETTDLAACAARVPATTFTAG